ncbi:MAG: cyclic nucleotide-binding domain-containing protein [Alphaproteobacteria bacterium]|nr:cyclic nucleotide-binding domain-containing protein [Alphaproteobacteria bacterium]
MRLEDFLEKNTKIKTFEKGTPIFTEGKQADAAYYIIEGKVEIFQEVNGQPSVIADLGPGEIFGEMAILRFDKYTLSARAAEATKVHVITPEILQKEINATHPLIRAILDMLVDRIHTVNEILIDFDRAKWP